MRITPMEIREQILKKKTFGYDCKEVDFLREVASDALEDATREISKLRSEVGRISQKLMEHEGREESLKKTLTTAQEMAEGLRGNAGKEAELIIKEAMLKADKILQHANNRAADIQTEVLNYKKQRIELEAKLRSVLEYHSNLLELGGEEARKADEKLEKLKYITKEG
ncbi:MAG: DivIVA domain-containing protein [Thermodesulfobacteriota bacterium]